MKTLIGTAVSTVLMAAAASAEAPKGGSAVQNTNPPKAPDTDVGDQTMAQLVSKPKAGDLKVAYEAIDTAYDIQWRQGGIADLEGKLDGLRGKIGEHVFEVAKQAYKTCSGKLVVVRSYFLALCKQAEEHIQSLHTEKHKEEEPISELIPLWGSYKSSIAKGLEKGIDPMERDELSKSLKYPTAAKYRAAVQALGSEGGTGSQAGEGRNTTNETKNHIQLVTKGWSVKMTAAMQTLMPELNRLTHEEQDQFVDAVLTLAASVKTFADGRENAAADNASDLNKGVVGEGDIDPGTKAALQAAMGPPAAKEETKSGNAKRKGPRAA